MAKQANILNMALKLHLFHINYTKLKLYLMKLDYVQIKTMNFTVVLKARKKENRRRVLEGNENQYGGEEKFV